MRTIVCGGVVLRRRLGLVVRLLTRLHGLDVGPVHVHRREVPVVVVDAGLAVSRPSSPAEHGGEGLGTPDLELLGPEFGGEFSPGLLGG